MKIYNEPDSHRRIREIEAVKLIARDYGIIAADASRGAYLTGAGDTYWADCSDDFSSINFIPCDCNLCRAFKELVNSKPKLPKNYKGSV